MPHYSRWRRAVMLLPLITVPALLLAGCGHAPSSPLTVVVAASATANETAPVLAPDDRALLYRAGAASGSSTAYVVNPNTGQPAKISLTPRRADGQVDYGPLRDQLLSQNVQRVQTVLNNEAATGPFDLLEEIVAAVRVTPAPATLLVLSSGLSTAGAFNLRDVGWDAGPSVVAAALRRGGYLPDLDGWRVIFSGLADTFGRQPALPLQQQTTLTAYWLAICHTAGAASCETDNMTRPDPAPRSTTPVPVVTVPVIDPFRGPRGSDGVSIPADMFFALNSARLLPGADSILRPLAARARAGHLLISVTGFASPDGGSHNAALSAFRARAVAARMIALSVPARQIIRVAGRGTAGKARSTCYRGGQLDEAVCARLRRVVILLSPPAGAPSYPAQTRRNHK